MSEHQEFDDNDQKTSDDGPVDVGEANQNQMEASMVAADSQEEIGDHTIDVNFVRYGGDIDSYQECLADFHIEEQYQKDGPNVAKPPPLFDGDTVCYHEIFEWLSLEDINAVGQTCKRLQAIAGGFLKYLPATKLRFTHRAIQSNNSCLPFVRKIIFIGDDKTFHHIASIKSDQLKSIEFSGNTEITIDRVKHIEGILKNIEVLKLFFCKVNSELYNCLLQFCTNLKHLIVGDGIGTSDQWLSKKYPKLENIELWDFKSEISKSDFRTFFEVNQQIKSLSIDLINVWNNRESLLISKIQLDVLSITIDPFKDFINALALLHQLYDQGFYRRLHVWVWGGNLYECLFALPRLNALKINPQKFMIGLNSSSSLTQLKELTLFGCILYVNASLATNLPNLERLDLQCGYRFNIVLPFLQHCKKLNQIKLGYFLDDINLFKWNTEREKLTGAWKVTIFVQEKDFLATKWSNKTIKLEFVEIRREDSYEWNDYFR